jgi:hypothetical protein
MLGKLSWAAIPFDQPIPLITGAVVLVVILGVLAWVVSGICPISGANGSPASITSGSASCTRCSPGDAAARILPTPS